MGKICGTRDDGTKKSLRGEEGGGRGRGKEKESNDFRLNSLGEERGREGGRERDREEKKEKGRKYREKLGRTFEAITRLEKYKSGT